MEISRIYFDMDGVLADFDGGVRDLCGIDPVSQDDKTGSDSDMWAAVRERPHFYAELELLPGARELFDAVLAKYGDRCQILTGIPKPSRGVVNAADDKKEWVKRLLSEDVRVNVVYRAEKPGFCTGKDCVLIDDLQCNIDGWEAVGGTGILHSGASETVAKLKEMDIL